VEFRQWTSFILAILITQLRTVSCIPGLYLSRAFERHEIIEVLYATSRIYQVTCTKLYSAEFSGVLLESNKVVCKLVGTEVPMNVSTLSLLSSSGIAEPSYGVTVLNPNICADVNHCPS